MDFHARQYDPQLGRFLGVDPLAASGGQDRFSPYAAMGNTPESMVDPNGLVPRNGYIDNSTPMFRGDNPMDNPMQMTRAVDEGGYNGGVNVGDGSFSDQMWGGGYAYILQKAAEERAKENTAAKTQGEEQTQGEGSIVSNLAGEKKTPTGPFNETEEHGDIPQTKAWDLDGNGKLDPDELQAWRENGHGKSIEVDASKLNVGYVDVSKLKKGDPYTFFFIQAFY